MDILVCVGETEDEALARWLYWRQKRYALAGYDGNGAFIFKGRRCVGNGLAGPYTFTHLTKAADGSATSPADMHAIEGRRLLLDHDQILRDRAIREAANTKELDRLLALYGSMPAPSLAELLPEAP